MSEPEPFRVVVVDADQRSRSLLVEAARSAGHEVTEFGDAQAALAAIPEGGYDVLVADAYLPGTHAVEFLSAIVSRHVEVSVIMMVAGAESALTGIECLKAGAMDYVTKPFEPEDLLLRITRAVERRSLLDEQRGHRQELETRLGQYSHDMRRLFLGAVESLACALEARDPNTRGHSARVSELGTAIALPLRLSEGQREKLRVAGLLHDIGKIGIPDDILKKRGRLTRSERTQIQMHPLIAVNILSPALADPETVAIIRHHHERVDGSGYPDGIGGEEIPAGARVLAAADAFDAMTSKRPYRAAYSREQALEEMRRCAGLQLDTDVVSVFHMLLYARANHRNREKPSDPESKEDQSPPSPPSDPA